MFYIKRFEKFIDETFWETNIDGDKIRINLSDVLYYLDNGFEIDPNDIKHLLIKVDRNIQRIESADLSYPVILLKSKGKFISILDGQHRTEKALRDGVNIKVRILDLDFAPDEFIKTFLKK
jgi:hypothetical protein